MLLSPQFPKSHVVTAVTRRRRRRVFTLDLEKPADLLSTAAKMLCQFDLALRPHRLECIGRRFLLRGRLVCLQPLDLHRGQRFFVFDLLANRQQILQKELIDLFRVERRNLSIGRVFTGRFRLGQCLTFHSAKRRYVNGTSPATLSHQCAFAPDQPPNWAKMDIQKQPNHKDVPRRKATCFSLDENRFLCPWWWLIW